MSIIDHLSCGKVIIFDSICVKNRWAFCIDYNLDEQIIYRGLFGLKCIDKKTFVGFARITDVFDYIEKPLSTDEIKRLKFAYKSSSLMKTQTKTSFFIDQLFKDAGIQLFVNSESVGTFHDTKDN